MIQSNSCTVNNEYGMIEDRKYKTMGKLCNSGIDQRTDWSGLSKEYLIPGGDEFQYQQGKENSK